MGNCDSKKPMSPTQTTITGSPQATAPKERKSSINFEIQCPTVIDEARESPILLVKRDPTKLFRYTDV